MLSVAWGAGDRGIVDSDAGTGFDIGAIAGSDAGTGEEIGIWGGAVVVEGAAGGSTTGSVTGSGSATGAARGAAGDRGVSGATVGWGGSFSLLTGAAAPEDLFCRKSMASPQ